MILQDSGSNINIGRVRGQYCSELSREETENLAVEAFRELADYGAPKNVKIALETVTIMQTNFINTLAEGAAMVDRVDRPNFRLMMDIFHLNLEEKDIYEPSAGTAPTISMYTWQTTTDGIRATADWILRRFLPPLRNADMTAISVRKFPDSFHGGGRSGRYPAFKAHCGPGLRTEGLMRETLEEHTWKNTGGNNEKHCVDPYSKERGSRL